MNDNEEDTKNYTIYFVQELGRDRIKIGRTTNLRGRLKTLQTSNSDKLTLLAYLPNQNSDMEKHIHEICGRYRLDGEWFKLSALTIHLIQHPYYKENIIFP